MVQKSDESPVDMVNIYIIYIYIISLYLQGELYVQTRWDSSGFPNLNWWGGPSLESRPQKPASYFRSNTPHILHWFWGELNHPRQGHLFLGHVEGYHVHSIYNDRRGPLCRKWSFLFVLFDLFLYTYIYHRDSGLTNIKCRLEYAIQNHLSVWVLNSCQNPSTTEA